MGGVFSDDPTLHQEPNMLHRGDISERIDPVG